MSTKIFISIHELDSKELNFVENYFLNSNKEYVSLRSLQNKGIWMLIKTFTSFKKYEEVIFIFNDKFYSFIEPLVYMLSLFIIKFNISRILPNYKYEKVTILERLSSIYKIFLSVIKIQILKQKTSLIIKKNISYGKHYNFCINQDTKVFYFKTNVGLGRNVGGSVGHTAGVVNSLSKKTNLMMFSLHEPIMINENIKKKILFIGDIVYSFPYELNRLKVNSVFFKRATHLIKKNKPQIIYQRLSLGDYSGAYFSNKYSIPLIIEYNSSDVWVNNNWGNNWGNKLKYSKLFKNIEEYVLKSADVIVTVSKVLQDELIERGFDKDKIVYYPNCIDKNIFDYKRYKEKDKLALRNILGFKAEDKIFTFIGTFGAWHGVEFLANTIVRLVEKHKQELDNNNIKFLIIGDGLLGEKVRSILNDLNVKKYVTLTGIIPQVDAPKYLSISDCFLSPHIKQKGKFIGSPTKLFEYMAFAKPIIASNLDQVGEIFDNKLFASDLLKVNEISNESAIVFEPDNYNEFINSILFVAKNNNIEKLGKNAYDMVMKKYTWDIHVDKIIDKFNKLNIAK